MSWNGFLDGAGAGARGRDTRRASELGSRHAKVLTTIWRHTTITGIEKSAGYRPFWREGVEQENQGSTPRSRSIIAMTLRETCGCALSRRPCTDRREIRACGRGRGILRPPMSLSLAGPPFCSPRKKLPAPACRIVNTLHRLKAHSPRATPGLTTRSTFVQIDHTPADIPVCRGYCYHPVLFVGRPYLTIAGRCGDERDHRASA